MGVDLYFCFNCKNCLHVDLFAVCDMCDDKLEDYNKSKTFCCKYCLHIQKQIDFNYTCRYKDLTEALILCCNCNPHFNKYYKKSKNTKEDIIEYCFGKDTSDELDNDEDNNSDN